MLTNTMSYIFLLSLCLISAINADLPNPPDLLSKRNAREFLDAHNAVRIRYGIPLLAWDKEVARYAHHHANQLIKTCTMVHSVNSPYGENIFWAQNPEMWKPADVVNSWAGESIWFNRTTLSCSAGPTKCGHYTQVVWYDTKRVGCRMLPCEVQPGMITVCSYDPPGNYNNEDPLVSHVPDPLLPSLPNPGLPLPQPQP